LAGNVAKNVDSKWVKMFTKRASVNATGLVGGYQPEFLMSVWDAATSGDIQVEED